MRAAERAKERPNERARERPNERAIHRRQRERGRVFDLAEINSRWRIKSRATSTRESEEIVEGERERRKRNSSLVLTRVSQDSGLPSLNQDSMLRGKSYICFFKL